MTAIEIDEKSPGGNCRETITNHVDEKMESVLGGKTNMSKANITLKSDETIPLNEISVIESEESPINMDILFHNLEMIIDPSTLENMIYLYESNQYEMLLTLDENIVELKLKSLLRLSREFGRRGTKISNVDSHMELSMVIPIIEDKISDKSVRIQNTFNTFCLKSINNVLTPYIAGENENINVLKLHLYDRKTLNRTHTTELGIITSHALMDQFSPGDFMTRNHTSLLREKPYEYEISEIHEIFDGLKRYLHTYKSKVSLMEYCYFGKYFSVETIRKTPVLLQAKNTNFRLSGYIPTNKKTEELIKIVDNLTGYVTRSDTMDYIFRLIQENLLNWYYLALEKGADSAEANHEIQPVIIAKFRREIENQRRKERARIFNEISNYMALIRQKLGNQVAAEIIMTRVFDVNSLLNQLTTQQRAIVIKARKTQVDYYDQLLHNNCAHVELYKKLRQLNEPNAIFPIYENLKKYFAKKTQNEHANIICNNCGFIIMCEHLQVFYENILKNRFGVKNDYAQLKALISPYLEIIPDTRIYYCKYCSEVISDISLEDSVSHESAEMYNDVNEELRKLMWNEMIYVLKSFTFSVLIDVPKLIKYAIINCYEFISEIEHQLIRNKTNSIEDTKNKIRLFVTIYGFAYFISLAMKNPQYKITLHGSRSDKLVDLIKLAIVTIMNTKNILISKISNINVDFVKNKILDAYKLVSQRTESVEMDKDSEDVVMSIISDPKYYLLWFINSYNSKILNFSKIESLLNISLESLSKKPTSLTLKDLYSKAKTPQDTKFIMNDDIKNYASIIQYMPQMQDLTYKYVIRGFHEWHLKSTKMIYTIPVYKQTADDSARNDIRNDTQTRMVSHDTAYSPEYYWFVKRFDEFRKNEKRLQDLRGFMRPYWVKAFPKTHKMFKRVEIALSRIYGEDGHQHNFTLYRDGEVFLTRADIEKNLAAGFPMKKLPRACSICKITLEETENLDETKVISNINRIINTDNMLKFYQNRCPEGDFHVWDNSVCKKCGKHTDDVDKDIYYDKYMDIFMKESKEIDSEVMFNVNNVESISKHTEIVPENIANWKYNHSIVTELIWLTKANINAFMALGDIEGQSYENVLSGKYIPQEPDNKNDLRISKLDSIIAMLTVEYNILINYSSTVNPPQVLQDLVEQQKYAGIVIVGLKNLESPFRDYLNRLTWIKKNRSVRVIVEFLLWTIADNLLFIYRNGKPENEALRRAFVASFVKRMLYRDKLTTKVLKINWNAFIRKGESDVKVDDVYDPNVDQTLGEELSPEEEEKEQELNDQDETTKDDEINMENTFDVDINSEENDFGDNEIGNTDVSIDE